MATKRDILRLQAEQHGLVPTSEFRSLEEYCLYLMHLRAYEEAARQAAGRSVLDLGCNNGYGTKILSAAARRTVGADVSPRAIEQARRSFAADGIEFWLSGGGRLPCDDGSFEVVASLQVIEHVSDYDAYLSEIRRVLAGGGVAVLTTPNALIRLRPGMKPINRFHVREFAADELGELLGRHFPRVEVRGLFATPELHAVELARTRRALALARRFGGIPFKVMGLLPYSLVQRVIRLVMSPKPGRLDESALRKYSTADFFYRDDRLDEALDLLAICHRDG